MKKIFNSLSYSVLWIVAGFLLFYSTISIGASCNLFTWSPSLDLNTVLSLILTIVIEVFIFWLAKRTQGYMTSIVSLLVCIALIGFGIFWFSEFQKETVGFTHHFTLRDKLSPTWFRIAFLTLFLIPQILWGCYPFRRLIKSRKS